MSNGFIWFDINARTASVGAVTDFYRAVFDGPIGCGESSPPQPDTVSAIRLATTNMGEETRIHIMLVPTVRLKGAGEPKFYHAAIQT